MIKCSKKWFIRMYLHVKSKLMDNDGYVFMFWVFSMLSFLATYTPNMNDVPLNYICSWIFRCKSRAWLSWESWIPRCKYHWSSHCSGGVNQQRDQSLGKMQPAHLLQSFRSTLRSWFVTVQVNFNICVFSLLLHKDWKAESDTDQHLHLSCLLFVCERSTMSLRTRWIVFMHTLFCVRIWIIWAGENMRRSSWQ